MPWLKQRVFDWLTPRVKPSRRGAFRHTVRSDRLRRRLSLELLEPLEMLANGTATIEFTSVPSVVQPNQTVDLSVRYRLTGNSNSSPWDVEVSLYDDDPIGDDRIASTTGSIRQQGTWYTHTFQAIRLSDFDDGGDGVELYAEVEIDDKTFNFVDAVDQSPVRRVAVGQPDLRVASLAVSATTVKHGDAVEIDAVVRNDGNADAAKSTVRYYFGPAAGSRQVYIGEGDIPNIGVLSPGEQSADSPTSFPESNFTIPVVPPGTYYVTAVADALGVVSESSEGNNERSQAITVGTIPEPPITRLICGTSTGPGVTIITHGFKAGAGASSVTPEWTLEMAEAVLRRADSSGSIFVHDPVSSSWVTPTERGAKPNDWRNSYDEDDELVLVFDWTRESDDPQQGWSEAAGDSLFANLAKPFDLLGEPIDLLSRPLHFIGHSRGTVVNRFTADRIGYHFPHVVIDQFTTLDPHPSTIHQDPLTVLDQGDQVEFVLSIPDNIRWADNYYRRDASTIASYELDLDFDGVRIPGAWNVQLDEDTLAGAGYGAEHSDVHLWYLATIDPADDLMEGFDLTAPGFDDWWKTETAIAEPSAGRANVGYARSRIGRALQLTGQMDRDALRSPTTPASVFNGDFSLGSFVVNTIPGWDRHGGGGDGQLDGDGYLELNSSNPLVNEQGLRRHNEMYIPPSVTGLVFDYWIYDDDGLLFGQSDVLEVVFDANVIHSISLADGETNGFVRDHAVPLLRNQVGAVSSLEFRINGMGLIDSGVRIDNVRLAGMQPGTGDGVDLDELHAAIVGRSVDPTFDLNRNGRVDAADGARFLDACNTPVGDTDQNGEFNSIDLISGFSAGVYGAAQPATWSEGDWDFDGDFDSDDLIAAFAGGASDQPSSAVRAERIDAAIA